MYACMSVKVNNDHGTRRPPKNPRQRPATTRRDLGNGKSYEMYELKMEKHSKSIKNNKNYKKNKKNQNNKNQ